MLRPCQLVGGVVAYSAKDIISDSRSNTGIMLMPPIGLMFPMRVLPVHVRSNPEDRLHSMSLSDGVIDVLDSNGSVSA